MMSTYIDKTASAIENLEALSHQYPDQASSYSEFSSSLSQKLYHQLTFDIHRFVANPQNVRTSDSATDGILNNNNFWVLYDQVLNCINDKLNPLTYARIASCVSDSLFEEKDGGAAKSLLDGLLQKFVEQIQLDSEEENVASRGYTKSMTRNLTSYIPARVFIESKLHMLSLQLMETEDSSTFDTNRLIPIKEFLETNKRTLTELASGTESDIAYVHSAYYECSMTYHKAVGPPEAYYNQAIQFLHYTSLDTLSSQRTYDLATDLSLAALTGEGVYNFGEVVNNNKALLDCLDGTRNEWLVKLMHACANGNVSELESITNMYSDAIGAQPALTSRANVVKEKLMLLALVNMVFERPSSERTLKFEDIAAQANTSLDQVELIVMRALSLGLIRGSMDQVEQTVHVTWVMPRVLDSTQIKALSERFGQWAVKVSKTRDQMSISVPTFG